MQKTKFSLNIKGELLELNSPKIMGILNVTPDSFYSDSRCFDEKHIIDRVSEIINQGGDIIDIGAYSSRPNSIDISVEEEMNRLRKSLSLINSQFSDTILSVDTFRADVAKMCVEEYGVAIINDISGGEIDKNMFSTVAKLNVPYILMHMKGTPQTMMMNMEYDNFLEEVFLYFSKKINQLRLLGVNDIIVDPGFGFSKSLDDNYQLMKHLNDFHIFELPLLVGISRKSMIYKLLDLTPKESLNGTTFLNTFALFKGANILRVHDVKEAKECARMYEMIINQK
ncbi:MAG: dihydropteroate synthase [Bacteroidales bacterium]|nr:dihydropteroate synthase [Bacteroidales bacterium]